MLLCVLLDLAGETTCMKNWYSCAEKNISSEQLCTLLLGHKQLLAPVTEEKIYKMFCSDFYSKRQGKLVAVLCFQKLAAFVKENSGHHGKRRREGKYKIRGYCEAWLSIVNSQILVLKREVHCQVQQQHLHLQSPFCISSMSWLYSVFFENLFKKFRAFYKHLIVPWG